MRGLYLAGVLMGLSLGGPAAAAPPPPAADLALLPPSVTLTGPRAAQQLLVEARSGGAFAGDRTSRARFVSSNPTVVKVEAGGILRAVGDGAATITATVDGRRTTVPVRVRESGRPFSWGFERHVQPVLTKTGCNSGACHGAAAGKGGLKLSLRGYDSAADFAVLTRQALGRRIVPSAPARSLLLQKPTMGIAHGGGMRFKVGSPEYQVLAGWIAAGAPAPAAGEPRVERLEVFPPEVRLKPGQEQQVLVRAVYSDGRAEDVTRWVKFGSSDESVAGVDEDGAVTVKGSGEGAVTAYFQSRVAFARVSAPYPANVPPAAFAGAERYNFIDTQVLSKLRALNIPPTGLASDEQFIRRAYLDAAGILPTPEEVEEFLRECAAERAGARLDGRNGSAEERKNGSPAAAASSIPPLLHSSTPKSRAALIDRLLQRPEFTDYWTYKWSDLLLVSSRKLPSKGMWAFYYWIRQSVAENKPWDQFAREVLTATGSTLTHGAANYYVLHKEPIDLTETTSQAFLGMSITCARCHNHPLEKWTQNDYYGMANLFGRIYLKNGEVAGETLVYPAESGEVNHPRLGRPMPPKPLDAPALSLNARQDRREFLARWLTAPENPYFARALVNRVWRNFMGRGLVEAEDDLRLTNPPSNEALLSALTRDFVAHRFDVRHLIRTIMTSAAYQRAAVAAPGAPVDGKYYSTYIPRRLPAEVLLDAVSQVTGVPTEFPGYPKGSRALQLADAQVASYFLTAFGRPQRVQTCSCERTEEPNVAQALHLSNGDTLNEKLRAPHGFVARLAAQKLPDEVVLERLYGVAFSRKPSRSERARVQAVLQRFPSGDPTRREVIEDLLSAMLTTREFLFNH